MRLLGALVFCAYLLVFPARAAEAAFEALALWARAVCPALFPFLVMLPVLTGEEARAAYARACARFMRALFDLPGEAASAVVVGLVAGSPAGALAARRAYLAGCMDSAQLLRACVLASGCGPVFLASSVGAGLLGSPGAGWALIVAQIGALFTAGVVFRLIAKSRAARGAKLARRERNTSPRASDAPPSAVRDAALNLMVIGGWMALFGVIASPLPSAAALILEVVSGGAVAARTGSLPLVAGVCGFGGLCILCQNLSALKGLGVSARAFAGAKILTGALCAFYCYLIERAAPRVSQAGARALASSARALPLAATLAVCMALVVTIISYCAKTRALDKSSKSDNVE